MRQVQEIDEARLEALLLAALASKRRPWDDACRRRIQAKAEQILRTFEDPARS